MRRASGFFSIVLLAVLLLLTGCGAPDETEVVKEESAEEEVVVEEEEEINGETEEAAEDEDTVYFEAEEYVLPETFPEFIATFQEIQYTGGHVDGQQTSVNYSHLGVEEVDGVETDKVEISVADEGAATLWVDSEGDFHKVIFEGEELPAAMAQQFAQPLLEAAMAPFHHASTFDLEDIFGEPIPGYDQNVIETGTETYGDLSATVYTIGFSVGPPAVEEDLSAEATAKLADFGDFQVITYWETTKLYGARDNKGIFSIDEFILR